jgi:tocopherol cyclase
MHYPPLQDPGVRAYPQQTPHSGRHFRPSHPAFHSHDQNKLRRAIRSIMNPLRRKSRQNHSKRFMEGWYYRLTLPEENVSFAFIFSIEDPNRYDEKRKSDLSLACVQVMGPKDEYVVQADKDHTKFWAWESQQGLGCIFHWKDETEKNDEVEAISPQEFHTKVKTGFQFLPNRLQGIVNGHDGSLGGVMEGQGLPRKCTFDLNIRPLSGWGDDEIENHKKKQSNQKSTAGWLASYSVFEPHWQITMADGRASGAVTWNDKKYVFVDAPFYAEKNWGGSFPSKWYWLQCNSFDGFTSADGSSRLSVTAGGGVRNIPFGRKENLGMVSIHHNGVFYEAVPWTSEVTWEVAPWGSWKFFGRCTSGARKFEVELIAECEEDGVVLRAPTKDEGMVYFCRDSFYAIASLSLYELIWDTEQNKYTRGKVIIDRAVSNSTAVEIGGGPYWNTWKGKSRMKQPLKALVRLPYLFR